MIDGTGAPPRGPMDIVITQDRITEITSVGFPKVPINDRGAAGEGRPRKSTAPACMSCPASSTCTCTAAAGRPTIPNTSTSCGSAHGVTTVRGVPCGSMDWDLQQRELSAKNQIVAPRIFAYHRPFTGEGWDRTKPQTPENAREWVRFAAKKGIDGLKLGAHDPEIMAALLDEAKKLGLGSTAHLDQMGVVRMNARAGVAPRPRHADALLRPVRVAAEGHQPAAVPGHAELQRRAASLRPGGAPVGQDSSARQRAVERADQGMGGSASSSSIRR